MQRGKNELELHIRAEFACLSAPSHITKIFGPLPGRRRLPVMYGCWQPAADRLLAWQKRRHCTGDAVPVPASQERASTLFT